MLLFFVSVTFVKNWDFWFCYPIINLRSYNTLVYIDINLSQRSINKWHKLRVVKTIKPRLEFNLSKVYSVCISTLKLKNTSRISAVFFNILRGVTTTSVFVVRFKLFLKRFIRKPERSLKEFWLVAGSPNLLTLKSRGSRMGKGKGKKVVRTLRFNPKQPLFGVSNLRFGKLRFTLAFVEQRLSVGCFLKLNSDFSFNWPYKQINLTGTKSFKNLPCRQLIEFR